MAEIHRQITKGIEKKKCKICNQNVANEYSSQKKHVLEKHMASILVNDRQHRLAAFLEKCFKQEGTVFITNDLQCNICGREYNYKGLIDNNKKIIFKSWSLSSCLHMPYGL